MGAAGINKQLIVEKVFTSLSHKSFIGRTFIGLSFFALIDFVLLQIKDLWQPCIENSLDAIFPTAFAYFVSLCYILIIFSTFQVFSFLLYLLW